MTRSLSGPKISAKMSSTYQNTLTDLSVVSITQPSFNYAKTLTSGVEENQANRTWQSVNRVLENMYQEIFDLYDMSGIDIGAGVGMDALGQAVVFEEIVAIAIVNENAIGAAGELEIFPSTSNGWKPIGNHTVATGGALSGQGCLFKANVAAGGFDVEQAAGSRITIRANGGSVTYSIYIIARHDDEASSSSSSTSSSMSTSSTSASSGSSSSLSSSSMSASSSSVSTSSMSTSSISISSISTSSSSTSSLSASSLSSSSLSSSSTSSTSSNSSSSQSESSSSVSISSIS